MQLRQQNSRGIENDGVWSLEQFQRFLEFLLELGVPDRLCSHRHLSYEFLQSTEDTNDGSLKDIGHLEYEERSKNPSPLKILHDCQLTVQICAKLAP